jgi:hypothetical protein
MGVSASTPTAADAGGGAGGDARPTAAAPAAAASPPGVMVMHALPHSASPPLDLVEIYPRVFVCGLPHTTTVVDKSRCNVDDLHRHLNRTFGASAWMVINLARAGQGYTPDRLNRQVSPAAQLFRVNGGISGGSP